MFLTYFIAKRRAAGEGADADGLACYVSVGMGHSRKNGIKISNVSTPYEFFMQYFCIAVTRNKLKHI